PFALPRRTMNTNPTPAANAVPARREPCPLHPKTPAVRRPTGLTTPTDPVASRVLALHHCAGAAEELDYSQAPAGEAHAAQQTTSPGSPAAPPSRTRTPASGSRPAGPPAAARPSPSPPPPEPPGCPLPRPVRRGWGGAAPETDAHATGPLKARRLLPSRGRGV